MENYSEETLSKLDEIINKLEKNESVSPDDYEIKYFNLLKDKGWIKSYKYTDGSYALIEKSNEFDSQLLGGNFSQRYYSNKSNYNSINIENSNNIAIGNIGNTIQNLTFGISEFNSLYDRAIKEIEQTDKLSSDEKDELKDLLNDIKVDLDDKKEPKKSLLKRIGQYSEKIISIGGSLAGIYEAIKPLFN